MPQSDTIRPLVTLDVDHISTDELVAVADWEGPAVTLAIDSSRHGIVAPDGPRRAKSLIDRLDVDVEFIDLTEHPERAAEAQALSGRPNIPVIVFGDGLVLVEPSDDELSAALDERGLGS